MNLTPLQLKGKGILTCVAGPRTRSQDLSAAFDPGLIPVLKRPAPDAALHSCCNNAAPCLPVTAACRQRLRRNPSDCLQCFPSRSRNVFPSRSQERSGSPVREMRDQTEAHQKGQDEWEKQYFLSNVWAVTVTLLNPPPCLLVSSCPRDPRWPSSRPGRSCASMSTWSAPTPTTTTGEQTNPGPSSRLLTR